MLVYGHKSYLKWVRGEKQVEIHCSRAKSRILGPLSLVGLHFLWILAMPARINVTIQQQLEDQRYLLIFVPCWKWLGRNTCLRGETRHDGHQREQIHISGHDTYEKWHFSHTAHFFRLQALGNLKHKSAGRIPLVNIMPTSCKHPGCHLRSINEKRSFLIRKKIFEIFAAQSLAWNDGFKRKIIQIFLMTFCLCKFFSLT